MSPEVRNKRNVINWSKSDVYSLGLTLLEAATLFDIGNFYELTEKEVVKLINLEVESSYLKEILPKMLVHNPAERISFAGLIGVNKILLDTPGSGLIDSTTIGDAIISIMAPKVLFDLSYQSSISLDLLRSMANNIISKKDKIQIVECNLKLN